MNTIAVSPQLTSKLPYWHELEKLSKDDKITLIAMLSLSIANTEFVPQKEEPKVKKLEQAMALLDTMMVKGGQPVPADEDGKGAMARIKYEV